jgi:SAM-dependent methyltransferase
MMAPTLEGAAPYALKPGCYSSHTLLLAELPPEGNGLRVLDLGCAGGYLSEILASRGFAVTGVDQPGTQRLPSIDFREADLDYDPIPIDSRFDFIVCADVLEHLRDPLRVLRQCRERLAPGGILLASLPNSGNLYVRWNVLLGRFPQHDRGLFDRTHLHFYAWNNWKELLEQAGFELEKFRCSSVPVGLALPRWEGSATARFLEWLSFCAARIWKEIFAYQFIVRARPERKR